MRQHVRRDLSADASDVIVDERIMLEGVMWCLCRVRYVSGPSGALVDTQKDGDQATSEAEENALVPEWRSEAEVRAWHATTGDGPARDGPPNGEDEANGRGELALPAPISETHEVATAAMQSRIDQIEEELERSTEAFNLYRARANSALKKTANEQQEVEERMAAAEAALEDQRGSVSEVEAAHRQQVDDWRARLAAAETRSEGLASELEEAQRAREEEAHARTREYDDQCKQKEEERAAVTEGMQAQLVTLNDQLERLEAELAKTRQHAQQRSELARKLLEEKDTEIAGLRIGAQRSVGGDGGESATSKTSEPGETAPTTGPHEGAAPNARPATDPNAADAGAVGGEAEAFMQLARMQAARESRSGGLQAEMDKLVATIAERDAQLVGTRAQIEGHAQHIRELKLAAHRQEELHHAEDGGDKLSYLKATIVRYMVSEDATRDKEALSRVISTILRFSPEEAAAVQTKHSTDQGTLASWGFFR